MSARALARPVAFTVDPSMYGHAYAPPRGVYGDLEKVVRTDLYYHYSTPVCAQRWLDLCDDPGYGHGALLDGVGSMAPGLARALREDAAGRRRLALTSLGPGDGAVDVRMLRGLAAEFQLSSYTGLDFSFELLRRSVNRVATAPDLPPGMAVAAVCGDFTGLGSLPLTHPDEGCVRLFTLMGFTLGNYPETELTDHIRSLMAEGDYLLVDARMHGLGALPADVGGLVGRGGGPGAGYQVDGVRRFVFGPVEVATLASADDVRFDIEASRTATDVPNALNLIIHCLGLDTRMRLTGEVVRRERLDLAVTTSYRREDLRGWLASSGFTLVWDDAFGDMAFFLLRR